MQGDTNQRLVKMHRQNPYRYNKERNKCDSGKCNSVAVQTDILLSKLIDRLEILHRPNQARCKTTDEWSMVGAGWWWGWVGYGGVEAASGDQPCVDCQSLFSLLRATFSFCTSNRFKENFFYIDLYTSAVWFSKEKNGTCRLIHCQ